MNIQRLSNKVRAKNLANATRNWWMASMRKLAADFAGKSIQLSSSTNFTAKFRKAVEALKLTNEGGIQMWVSSTNHAVSLNVKVSVTDGGHTCYADAWYFLGSLDRGVLTPDGNAGEHWPVEYTVDAILKAREEVKEARMRLQFAENALAGFGESDHN